MQVERTQLSVAVSALGVAAYNRKLQSYSCSDNTEVHFLCVSGPEVTRPGQASMAALWA